MQSNDIDLAQYPTVVSTNTTDNTPTYAYSQYLGTTNNDPNRRTDTGAFRPALVPVPISDDSVEETDPNDFAVGARNTTSPTLQPIDDGTPTQTELSTTPVFTVFNTDDGRRIGSPIHTGMHPGNGCIRVRKPKNPSPLSTQHPRFALTSGEDQPSEEKREPLVVLPVQGTRGYFTSFEGLDTYTKIER